MATLLHEWVDDVIVNLQIRHSKSFARGINVIQTPALPPEDYLYPSPRTNVVISHVPKPANTHASTLGKSPSVRLVTRLATRSARRW